MMNTTQADDYGPSIHALQPRQMGGLPLIQPILADLQVRILVNELVPSAADVDLGQVVVLLVLNRLLAPQPLYEVQDWVGGTVLPEVLGIPVAQAYDNRLGRTLDRLYPQLGELWQRLVIRAVETYALDLAVLHWDLTSIYFEGAYAESELASYGYSRDQRPDTKQITLEVDITHDGSVPVLYQVLRGNTVDVTRPVPHLEALLRFLARPALAERHLQPLLVSDCKMITPEVVLACHRHHCYYLGPLQEGMAVMAALRSVSAAELADHPLAYRPQRVKATDDRFVPYRGVWRPFVFEHVGKQVTDRVLVVWSAGKERLDQEKRKTYLKRLLNGLERVQSKLNTGRYKKSAYVTQRIVALQRGNPMHRLVDVDLHGEDGALALHFALNQERLAEARALDGRYALATNGGHLSDTEALTLFKGQDGIEKRFRAVKGPLLVHPLFVRTDRRIEGLVFITLVALLVRAILERLCRQHDLSLTADRLLRGFANLQAVDVTWADGSIQRRAAQMSSLQSQVLTALGWPLPPTYAQSTRHSADAPL
jgi:transposase